VVIMMGRGRLEERKRRRKEKKKERNKCERK
jgi:hypothetical protein